MFLCVLKAFLQHSVLSYPPSWILSWSYKGVGPGNQLTSECAYSLRVTSSSHNRDFKQIATADANTAAGSKFPPKGDTAHVRRLQPAVA